MTINYKPKNILRRMAAKKHIERLVTQKLTVNRAVVNLLAKSGVLTEKELERIALKVIKDYKRKFRDEIRSGNTKKEALENAVNEKRQMVQRIQNATVHEITKAVQRQYRGEFYEWLPSTAAKPDEKHMRKYGKIYQVGKGEMPGDRYGCKCGMKILVNDSRLKIGE